VIRVAEFWVNEPLMYEMVTWIRHNTWVLRVEITAFYHTVITSNEQQKIEKLSEHQRSDTMQSILSVLFRVHSRFRPLILYQHSLNDMFSCILMSYVKSRPLNCPSLLWEAANEWTVMKFWHNSIFGVEYQPDYCGVEMKLIWTARLRK